MALFFSNLSRYLTTLSLTGAKRPQTRIFMFNQAVKKKDLWAVSNSLGHTMTLPCREDYQGFRFSIGVLGTRTRAEVKGTKSHLMAEMLSSIGRPVYLIDTRRNGVGAQSSWSPRE